jgi:hypothetical protein
MVSPKTLVIYTNPTLTSPSPSIDKRSKESVIYILSVSNQVLVTYGPVADATLKSKKRKKKKGRRRNGWEFKMEK